MENLLDENGLPNENATPEKKTKKAEKTAFKKREPAPSAVILTREEMTEEKIKQLPLHANEKVILQVEDGYLFHKGNGVVYYRSYVEVLTYHDENRFHAEEVKNVPARPQSGLPR